MCGNYAGTPLALSPFKMSLKKWHMIHLKDKWNEMYKDEHYQTECRTCGSLHHGESGSQMDYFYCGNKLRDWQKSGERCWHPVGTIPVVDEQEEDKNETV